ncbi:MAG: hypothetical protein H0X08_02890 [Blastocatellia bacterium]|nr:hypothetical protein [Blastocatellia bacterium]
MDEKLDSLRQCSNIDERSIVSMLEVHFGFVKLLCEITGLDKRSLASKYLHFHKPKLFYIYDSMANAGLSKAMPKYRGRKVSSDDKFDAAYSSYSFKLLELQKEIKQEFGDQLTPRQLDRMLLKLNAEAVA